MDPQLGSPRTFFALLDAARSGSVDALGEIFRSCEAELLALAHRQLRSQLAVKAGAADLVQDTFLEAQQAFPTFKGESRGQLMAWLRRILLASATSAWKSA